MSNESESNDSTQTADSISSGTAVKGQLSSSSDVDYYKLTASSSGSVEIVLDTALSSYASDSYTVTLYDSENNSLGSYTGNDMTVNMGIPTAGTYYLKLSNNGYYFSSEQYSLKVAFPASEVPDGEEKQFSEKEPNDIFPNLITLNDEITGQLESAEDVDLFKFKISSKSVVDIAFDSPSSNLANENFIVSVTNSDGLTLLSQVINSSTSLSMIANRADEYVLKVKSSTSYSNSPYEFVVNAVAIIDGRETEPNNSISTANEILSGKTYSGNLQDKEDKDVFYVDMESAGKIKLDFETPVNSATNNYYRIRIIDAESAEIALRDVGASSSIEAEIVLPGRYYVEITDPHFAYIDTDYQIVATLELSEPIPSGAIRGSSNGEIISGTENDDLIYGLGGDDQIDGLDGDDIVVFRTEEERLSVTTIAGLTLVRADFSAGEHAYSTTRLWNVETLRTRTGESLLITGTNKPISGSLESEVLTGTDGNDLFDPAGGSDFIDGASGADKIAIFAPQERFKILTIEGVTKLFADSRANEYASNTLTVVNVEEIEFSTGKLLTLQTTDSNKLFGSIFDDQIQGTIGDDVIDGNGGTDTVDGGLGEDTVILFGNVSDFSITFPTLETNLLTVSGKEATNSAGIKINATNVEKLSFNDFTVDVSNPPSIITNITTDLIAEGGKNATVSIALGVNPGGPVKLNLQSSSQLALDQTSLVFDSENWNTIQEVSVSASDDSLFEKLHSGMLTISPDSSSSPLYKVVSPKEIEFKIQDNDASNFGSINGQLWNDRNSNGLVDLGEQVLSGWTVFLDKNSNGRLDSGEYSVITSSSGWYLFEGLEPGKYDVVTKIKAGWSPTFPDKLTSQTVVVNAQSSNQTFTNGDWGGYTKEQYPSIFAESGAGIEYSNLGRSTRIQDFLADVRFGSDQGEGYAVAVIDTGAQLNHPDFADRIVFQYDFSGPNDDDASDYNGHGTHVAGTIVSSNGLFPGIAPKANLVVLKVFPDSNPRASTNDIIEALRWVLQNHQKYNIVAVNMSLGSGEFDQFERTGSYSDWLKALAAQGVVTVSASGNDYDDYNGRYLGVSYPSSDKYSLSVGSVFARAGNHGWWDGSKLVPDILLQTAATDSISVFSQRGLLSDIFAPGSWINASWIDGGHKPISGTSMASPQIAGMVLLAQELAEKELGRRLTFEEIKTLLAESGDPIYDGDDEGYSSSISASETSYIRVNMVKLGEAILNLKPPASYRINVEAGESSSSNNFGFVANEGVSSTAASDLIVGSSLGNVIFGGAGDDDIQGGGGDDRIYGESGDDVLSGGSGDDELSGGGGDDQIDGGEGTDTVVFNFLRDACTIANTSSGVKVSHPTNGEDFLINCEFLQFSDQTLSIESLIVDESPPEIVVSLPRDTATAVSPTENLVITYDEAIEAGVGVGTLTDSTGRLTASFSANSASVQIAGSTLTLLLSSFLKENGTYSVELPQGFVVDTSGNGSGEIDVDFSTLDMVAPEVNLLDASRFLDTGTEGSLTITFSENLSKGSGVLSFKNLKNGEVETYTVDEYPGLELTDLTLILPKLEFKVDQDSYILTLSEGSISDQAGNKLEEINMYLGGTGDDVITSDADVRFISGGGGADTLSFEHSFGDYHVSRNPSSAVIEVASKTGSILHYVSADVESLAFQDLSLSATDINYLGDVSAVPDGSIATVFRFYNARDNAFFYTDSVAERDMVMSNSDVSITVDKWPYIYQGSTFERAHSYPDSDQVVPLFRFYNTETGHHFFTVSVDESEFIQAKSASGEWPFNYEGAVFNVYASDPNLSFIGEELAVHRFYSPSLNRHFFTGDPEEAAEIQLTGQWNYEGIAFYGEII